MKRTLDDDSGEITTDVSAAETEASKPTKHSPKKARRFCAEQFRSKIQTDDKNTELNHFLTLLKNREQCEEVIFEYFQSGGNCLELMQLWEFDTECSATLILEIVQRLIVSVIANHPDMHLATLEACRYLLNTHMTLINQMLQLASTQTERWTTLKLLATMVSFSPTLVKDILLNVNFQVNLLTKHMDNLAQSVRLAFINFLLAFFIDGHYPTMLQLMGRKFMFGSIMPGLKYDPIETVTMVLMTLKMHIVDNESVPKPVRIKLFTNTVVKGMVHLYDWRGPHCMEEKRQRPIEGDVNPEHRRDIAKLTHELLIVLCTSIKRGVIFRDETFGTGVQHRNPLMFNIIEMSFSDARYSELQQELIIRMAVECPDLVKTVWAKLLPSLEPRPTVKWLRAIVFLRQLVSAIRPHGSVHFAKHLRPLQFAQVIQFLVTPTLVLEQLVSGDAGFEFQSAIVKQEVVLAINAILIAVQGFMVKTKEVLSENYCRTLKSLIEDHLQRNMPSADLLLKDWLEIPKCDLDSNGRLPPYERLVYMTEVVKVLRLYHELCPELLSNLRFMNVDDLLNFDFAECSECDMGKVHSFKVTLVELLIQLDPTQFHVTGEIFPMALEILSKSLRTQETTAEPIDIEVTNVRHCISNILTLTGLFTDCEYEVPIWTDVLKHKHLSEFLSQVLASPQADAHKLCEKFSGFDVTLVETQKDLLDTICAPGYSSTTSVKEMKPVLFSSVITTALQQECPNKKVKKHLGNIAVQIFHLQTDYRSFQQLVKTYPANLSDSAIQYITSWPESVVEVPLLPETNYVYLKQIQETSTALFKLLNIENTAEDDYSALVETLKKHASKTLDMIYCHPKMVACFQPQNMQKSVASANCVRCFTEITEHLRSTEAKLDITAYLQCYQLRLCNCVQKVVAQDAEVYSRSTIDKFTRVMHILGLSLEECVRILDQLALHHVSDFFDAEQKPNFIYYVLVEALNNLGKCCEAIDRDTDDDTDTDDREIHACIKPLLRVLSELNNLNVDSSDFAAAMRRYLTRHTAKINGDNTREYFVSAMRKEEYCKENALLAIMIFKTTQENHATTQIGESLHDAFVENLSVICLKKGMILPLLETINIDDELGVRTMELLTPMLQKTLQKPSKAGQHVEKHYAGFCKVLQAHVPSVLVETYLDKIQRADTTDVFLPAIWKAMFTKYFADCIANNNREKQVNNALLTFVNYIVNMLKSFLKKNNADEHALDNVEVQGLKEVSSFFVDVIEKVPGDVSVESTSTNETLKVLCRQCLQLGVGSTRIYLLNLLTAVMKQIQFTIEDTLELMDMLFAHPEYMTVALAEPSDVKLAVFDLVHVMCKSQPVMQKKHVPMLLSAYSATMHPADRRVLSLLTRYERAREHTLFYDFKPFLWGLAAANFYTPRSESRNRLRRQPRTGDVLDILQVQMIESTILSFPLDTPLGEGVLDSGLDNELASKVYDIGFLISVFSQLLEPDCTLATHKFTHSGALSLVVVALASINRDVRSAACHVLALFCYHLEARGTGKDHLLWLRFVEVVSKAAGSVDNLKLNSFSALFMARTAMVLTNPTDPMYEPLGNFIGVTTAPNLTRIPELYTILHSNEVDHELRKHFILQILYDGMRTEDDGAVVESAMAFKLIMDLFSCASCDVQSKLIILDIMERAAGLANTARVLCTVHGLAVWLYNIITRHSDPMVLTKVIKIYNRILEHEGLESIMVTIGIEITRLRTLYGSSLDV